MTKVVALCSGSVSIQPRDQSQLTNSHEGIEIGELVFRQLFRCGVLRQQVDSSQGLEDLIVICKGSVRLIDQVGERGSPID